ncbi:GyrI-like domain-containing protein [Aquimarina sp. AU474]|uniref:GyrI-like domain-containing protein n=1 Tax=Aquimarina sp. AU474 TaxID=2108529 RepID=UPI000D69A910|nr:GyrI-like domain-containing protein [Aquimarina sp. AU474]
MKKIIVIVLVACLGLATWYLLIKKHDYVITFNSNTSPQSVYNYVKSKKFIDTTSMQWNAIIKDSVVSKSMVQEITLEDEKILLDWTFNSIADTITKIDVGIVSENHSVKNRIQALTGSSNSVKRVKSELIRLRQEFLKYTNTFKVIVDGESETPDMHIISTQTEGQRDLKAKMMMNANAYLYPKLDENKITQDGSPFVKIRDWDKKNNKIKFDFGVPIVRKDTVPDTIPNIKFNNIKSRKALKATFYGNYSISDEAWLVLLEYADKNNISVEHKPLEIFYNNPMAGGNQIEWKAEVFLPIKE